MHKKLRRISQRSVLDMPVWLECQRIERWTRKFTCDPVDYGVVAISGGIRIQCTLDQYQEAVSIVHSASMRN